MTSDPLDNLLELAIGYGASPTDVLNWTWGEASLFVKAHIRHERDMLRNRAMMDATAIGIIGRLLSGSAGSRQNIMDLYPFLWSQEERNEAKVAALRARLEAGVSGKTDTEGGENNHGVK